MHSDVSIYVAYFGEFFIRRLRHRNRPSPEEAEIGDGKGDEEAHEKGQEPRNETHPPKDLPGGPPFEDPPKDPSYYQLVIDNDSGTYRPNAELLPLLKKLMQYNFPRLRVLTLDCRKDTERTERMKDEQRKKRRRKETLYIIRLRGAARSVAAMSAVWTA